MHLQPHRHPKPRFRHPQQLASPPRPKGQARNQLRPPPRLLSSGASAARAATGTRPKAKATDKAMLKANAHGRTEHFPLCMMLLPFPDDEAIHMSRRDAEGSAMSRSRPAMPMVPRCRPSCSRSGRTARFPSSDGTLPRPQALATRSAQGGAAQWPAFLHGPRELVKRTWSEASASAASAPPHQTR